MPSRSTERGAAATPWVELAGVIGSPSRSAWLSHGVGARASRASEPVVGVAQVRRQRGAVGDRDSTGSACRQAPPRLTRRVPVAGPRGLRGGERA